MPMPLPPLPLSYSCVVVPSHNHFLSSITAAHPRTPHPLSFPIPVAVLIVLIYRLLEQRRGRRCSFPTLGRPASSSSTLLLHPLRRCILVPLRLLSLPSSC
ncbi:hypothetical protein BHM03_00030530 [Ensete ventricosum]|nr:hypothetical protein BHM03_00030530 [Ensete ventricosum]